MFHLFRCSNLTPYPNPSLPQHKEKEIQQYSFCTANLPFFTILHGLWYKWSLEKYIKVVPKNIYSRKSTTLDYSRWILWWAGTYENCTSLYWIFHECFLLQQVILNFQLKSSLKIRDKQRQTYRIRISKTSINQLQSILLPIIPAEFHYKLGK